MQTTFYSFHLAAISVHVRLPEHLYSPHSTRSVMRGGTEIRYQDICRVLTSLASPLKKEGYFIASLQTSRLSDLSQLDLVKSVPIVFFSFSLYPDFQLIRRDGPGLNGTMTVDARQWPTCYKGRPGDKTLQTH